MMVNGLGAVATGITTLVVLVTKFAEGAWITVLLIAAMILFMRAVNRHYRRVDDEINLDRPFIPAEVSEPIIILPIDRWSRVTEKALSFALSMSHDIRCVHVQTAKARSVLRRSGIETLWPRSRPRASAFQGWSRSNHPSVTCCCRSSTMC